MKAKLHLFVLFLVAFALDSLCQQREYEFRNYSQEDGLPSNESYFVYRDSKDFLWFATDQGVVRFNGSRMERFELSDNVVFKIREDSKGRVWFFTHTGRLSYFYKGAIHPYRYNDSIAKAFKTLIIGNAYVTDDDEIIVIAALDNFTISRNGVVKKFKYLTAGVDSVVFNIRKLDGKEYFTRILRTNNLKVDTFHINLELKGRTISYKVPVGLGVFPQYGCATKNEKEFFFFYGRTLVRLNEDGSFKAMTFPVIISSIELNENLWVGFLNNSGAALLDTGLNIIYRDPSLNKKSVTSIRTDHEGGTWFSTLEKGIFYLKNPHVSRITGDSSLNKPVLRIFRTDDSSMLFANTDRIYRFSGKRISSLLKHDQHYSKITDMFVDNNQNLYAAGLRNPYTGTCTYVNYIKTNDRLYKNIFFIFSLSKIIHRQGDIYLVNRHEYSRLFKMPDDQGGKRLPGCIDWVGTLDSTLYKPGFLFRDTKDQVWLGAINGFYRSNAGENKLLEYRPADTLFKKGMTCMDQLHNGLYTIGIRFGGVALMRDSTVITTITEKDGLLSNAIKYLLPLKDRLWVATGKGVSVIQFRSYDPVRYSITNIGKNEGLYNTIINQLVPSGSSILAATNNGIYEIANAEQFLTTRQKPVPFYINSLSYYRGDTSDISSITLPYKNNKVVIRYSAVSFNLADEIKYYYRFDDADTSWHEIDATELLMENLIPGTYDLEIMAAIPIEKRFSEIKRLQIIVEKPWWQNNLLRVTAVLLMLAAIYIFLKRRIATVTRREQQNTALQAKMSELEQTALRSQMNPHFIFNCLTSIQQLIVTGNKDEANEYLVKFARLIRKTLELSRHSFISIEEETNYLSEYVELEQLRIPGQFEFSISIDPAINIEHTGIPNMMLQPVIENSIRHGIKHLENKKGKILVSLEQRADHILCTVTDNGVGRSAFGRPDESGISETKSYGMSIVSKRLEILSPGNEGRMLEITDLYNADGSAAGTKVILQLPF